MHIFALKKGLHAFETIVQVPDQDHAVAAPRQQVRAIVAHLEDPNAVLVSLQTLDYKIILEVINFDLVLSCGVEKVIALIVDDHRVELRAVFPDFADLDFFFQIKYSEWLI